MDNQFNWAVFEFTSGSNPYIVKTQKEKIKMLKKYKDNEIKSIGENHYLIDDKQEDLFAVEEAYHIDNKDIMEKADELYSNLEKDGWEPVKDVDTGKFYYSIFRKFDGDSKKGMWKAIKYNEDYFPEIIDISYAQANGDEPLDAGKQLQKAIGQLLFGKKSVNEASKLPRNASKIVARSKFDADRNLTKDDFGWKDDNDGHYISPNDLRAYYDIEVLETNPDYKPNITKTEYVVQGNYGYGWDDLTSSSDYKEAKADLRDYRENELNASHRLITRRIPVNESTDKNLYVVHSFSDDSILFKGTEEECGQYINKHGIEDTAEIAQLYKPEEHTELSYCPECGDLSFNSKKGNCTKCFYVESYDEEFMEDDIHPITEDDESIRASEVKNVASKVFSEMAKNDDGSGKWKSVVSTVLDNVSDEDIDNIASEVKNKFGEIKLSQEDKKKLSRAASSKEEKDWIDKAETVLDALDWSSHGNKNPKLLKRILQVIIYIVMVIEPTPVGEIIATVITVLPPKANAKLFEILNTISLPGVGMMKLLKLLLKWLKNKKAEKSQDDDLQTNEEMEELEGLYAY